MSLTYLIFYSPPRRDLRSGLAVGAHWAVGWGWPVGMCGHQPSAPRTPVRKESAGQTRRNRRINFGREAEKMGASRSPGWTSRIAVWTCLCIKWESWRVSWRFRPTLPPSLIFFSNKRSKLNFCKYTKIGIQWHYVLPRLLTRILGINDVQFFFRKSVKCLEVPPIMFKIDVKSNHRHR